MAGTQSFDLTCGCDIQEVDNAINQALKEIRQRYDFKGFSVNIDLKREENKIVLRGPDDFKLRAMWDIVQEKMVRRKVPLKNLHPGKALPAAGGTVMQEISLQQGIPIETARSIVKFVKDLRMKKVQAQIQGDQMRISSPKRDDLQTVISRIKEKDFGLELKFGNYRGN